METIIFMFCLTLHNIEEALWLNDWRIKTIPNSRRSPKKEHFIFAVLGITVLGYLTAGLFTLFPNNQYFEYVFVGFVGAMLINAFVPEGYNGIGITGPSYRYQFGNQQGKRLVYQMGTKAQRKFVHHENILCTPSLESGSDSHPKAN